MVDRVVDSVDTDGVDAELLKVLDVSHAASLVGKGIFGVRGATGLVVNTTDVETVVASEESVALDCDGRKAGRRSARCSSLKSRGGGSQSCAQGDGCGSD